MKRRPYSAPVFAAAVGPSEFLTNYDPHKWLTALEAAVYLRKFKRKDGKPSVGAIRNLVYRGLLAAYKPFGRLLFSRTELDRQIEATRKDGR